MRKFNIVLLVLIALMGVLVAPAAFAQDTAEVSTGCTALASDVTVSTASFTGDFLAGESITFSVDEDFVAGNTYTISIDGVNVATGYTQETYTHTFAADDTGVVIQITVTAGTFTVVVACNNAEEEPEDFTLCHIPPGNPGAAHTITVGSQNAFNTHLNNHGDSPGSCPEGINSRADDIGAGLIFFIILDTDGEGGNDVTEVISILGLCEEGECASIVDIEITQVVILVGTLGEGEYVEFDAGDDDGYTVRIYYLGYQDRDGDADSDEVFQINVYFNGVLTNDDVLILIADDGSIAWTLNADRGVDISIIFGNGDDEDDADECEVDDADDTDEADDTTDAEDDECEVEDDNT
jgi:hypothetical protein